MKKMALHWKIILGLVFGILWAFLSIHFGFSTFTQHWISPFGDIFLKLLKLIAIPLVLFSIVTGIADLADISKLGRMGVKTILVYTGTTVLAISLGLFLVNIIGPGEKIPENLKISNRLQYEEWRNKNGIEKVDEKNLLTDTNYSKYLSDLNIENNVSPDIVAKVEGANKAIEQGPLAFLVDIVPDNIVQSLSSTSLMLQVIFFAIFLGIAIKKIEDKHSSFLFQMFNSLNHAYLAMIDMVMKASPIFVFCLMAGNLVSMAGKDSSKLLEILTGLIKYGSVVILGLALLLFVFYPTMYAMFGKRANQEDTFFLRYVYFFKAMGPAQLLAFSTSSSAATLPLTMDCVKNNLKVSKETGNFVIPIGATINMDGTSLYQAVAVIFLAQIHWIDLSLGQQLTIVLTATLASIGSAAVPSAGLIMLIMVLQSVNLNPLWIAIILPIDRILDMCRTVINVSGDGLVSSIIDRWEKNTTK
jgi:Na+/H+-dicarboxylate symporter